MTHNFLLKYKLTTITYIERHYMYVNLYLSSSEFISMHSKIKVTENIVLAERIHLFLAAVYKCNVTPPFQTPSYICYKYTQSISKLCAGIIIKLQYIFMGFTRTYMRQFIINKRVAILFFICYFENKQVASLGT
jgi:hypothetical protein